MRHDSTNDHGERHRRHRCKHRARRRGRHGARGRLFAAGELRIALLGLLHDGPAHGYELMQRLSDRTEGRYEPSAGATYPILQQLQDEGLASVETSGGKKIYRLTADGVALVEESAAELDEIWQRAAIWRQWSRLDAPELGGMKELKGLVTAILDRVQDPDRGPEIRKKIRAILAGAADRVRGL